MQGTLKVLFNGFEPGDGDDVPEITALGTCLREKSSRITLWV